MACCISNTERISDTRCRPACTKKICLSSFPQFTSCSLYMNNFYLVECSWCVCRPSTKQRNDNCHAGLLSFAACLASVPVSSGIATPSGPLDLHSRMEFCGAAAVGSLLVFLHIVLQPTALLLLHSSCLLGLYCTTVKSLANCVRIICRFPFFAVQQMLQLADVMRKDAAPREVPVLLKWLRYSGRASLIFA